MARTLANAGSSLPARFMALASPHLRDFFNLLRAAWQEYERDYARYFAVAMIFYALMSLVPLLLLLLAGLGLLLRRSAVAATAEQQVLEAIQIGFGSELRTTVEHLLAGIAATIGGHIHRQPGRLDADRVSPGASPALELPRDLEAPADIDLGLLARGDLAVDARKGPCFRYGGRGRRCVAC